MQFTTPIAIPKSNVRLFHQQPILLIGSCFTQSIGEKLLYNKFSATINPSGIIYNPISIVNTLNRVVNNQPYNEKELRQINDKWISFNHHGSFSSFDKHECLEQINNTLKDAHLQLKGCETIFISLGSAWVYEYPAIGIVANCHKIPNNEFKKRLLSVKEILIAFENVINQLENINIIFTVSPVRHIKDGVHENNLSKSTLHLAINNLVKQHDNCHYFPAYEIIIDELRDYRFYKEDMVHPTYIAVDYVWEKFTECYFDTETQNLNTEIQKIKTATTHRSFNYESDEHQKFIANQIQLMVEMSNKYSFLDFEAEKRKIQSL